MDKTYYYSKPSAGENGALVCRLKNRSAVTSLAIDEFAKCVACKGCTFTAAEMHGRNASDWISQQLFVVDVDNDKANTPNLTMNDSIQLLEDIGIHVCFTYYTFSSTKEQPRYRLIIVSDSVFTNSDEAQRVNRFLVGLHPQFDGACSDNGRMYYGSNTGVIYSNFDMATSKEVLLTLSANTENIVNKYCNNTPNKQKATTPATPLGKKIAEYDLLSFIREDIGMDGRRIGNEIGFSPCPICGHNDCFTVNPEKNVYMCFSSDCFGGGNIIDYLMHRYNWNLSQARNYFINNISTVATNASDVQQPACSASTVIVSTKIDSMVIGNRLDTVAFAEFMASKYLYLCAVNRKTKRSDFYRYIDGVYRPYSDDELRCAIRRELKPLGNVYCSSNIIEEICKQIHFCVSHISDEELNCRDDLINFRNGILDVPSCRLLSHTPSIYSSVQIPCDWNPNPSEPTVFNRFMNDLTSGDSETKELLMQFLGLIISNYPCYRLKKALFLTGAGNTGKSKLKALAEHIVGEENCVSVSLDDIEKTRFMMSSLYGKRLAGCADMNYSHFSSLSNFKQLTGGDSITVDEKFKQPITFTYTGLLWFCCNVLPSFSGDNGKWVYDRFLVVPCKNPIPEEKQDTNILEKMLKEKESIVYLAVMAFKRLIDNDFKLINPTACIKARESYEYKNNNVISFFNECCSIKENGNNWKQHTKREVYLLYTNWCKNNSIYPESNQKFKEELQKYLNKSAKDLVVRKSDNEYYCFYVSANSYAEYIAL